MWKGQRRKKLLATPFPAEWKRIVETCCAFYHRLPEPDRRELEGHTQVFMAEKKFEGCGGLTMNEGTRLCIAAQACLLLLHRQTDYYPGLQTILVYPSSFVVPTIRHLGNGVVVENHESLLGQSWKSGAVVLAWDEVCRGLLDDTQSNVILHEFAHQLDYEDGGNADGTPALGAGESLLTRKRRNDTWRQVMSTEFEQLRRRVQSGKEGLLRAYGATNPAEFFAVATEIFFGRPREMRGQHPALYTELKWYYPQDPAEWSADGCLTGR